MAKTVYPLDMSLLRKIGFAISVVANKKITLKTSSGTWYFVHGALQTEHCKLHSAHHTLNTTYLTMHAVIQHAKAKLHW